MHSKTVAIYIHISTAEELVEETTGYDAETVETFLDIAFNSERMMIK